MQPTGEMPAPAALDDFVVAFESARARDETTDLEGFLPPPDHALYLSVLRELVCVDLEFGWGSGRPRSLDDYLRRYPALNADPTALRCVAREEFRQRHQAGQARDPAEYEERYGVPTADWSLPTTSPGLASPGEEDFDLSTGMGPQPGTTTAGGATRRPAVSLVPALAPHQTGDVPALLRRRLRLVALGVVGALAYLAALALVNPREKVGLFLESSPLVALNSVLLAVCAALAWLLWSRRALSLGRLRLIETALVGLLAAELGAGLFSDLFLDDELSQPLAGGDHALFHYASSWSLPFFALIVAYGTLIPTTGRRCAAVVGVLALVPLAISAAAGVAVGAIGPPFLRSFLLQTALWMAAAAGIAAYGATRLEALRQAASEARRLGQYRLVRRLGSGGMGEVYLAEHVLLRRPCAVKLIRPEMAGDLGMRRRFEREARAAAALTHPNTCTVFDYGTADDGTFYCAMEYLPGPTLDQLVGHEGPLDPPRSVRLLRQLCGALWEAHRGGLVHRDVKPSNVIVCERGGVLDVAKLLDFGLAQGQRVPGGVKRTAPEGIFAGTPAYTSPEQAEGRTLDARSDLYSLGAVAYFLLTGRPPFARSGAQETMAAHIRDAVIPLRELRPDVPTDLEAVVLRCLEKDPGRRFPDAGSLERALAGCACTAK